MNREKVIELFSSCISKGGWNNCTNCEHGKAQAALTCKPLAEDVLKVLKEQNTVDHALEVLRQAGWKETQDVPFPAELLKEQEAKQVIRKQCKKEYDDGSIDYFAEWYCPHCNMLILRGFDNPSIKFCYKCGKPILWKGR